MQFLLYTTMLISTTLVLALPVPTASSISSHDYHRLSHISPIWSEDEPSQRGDKDDETSDYRTLSVESYSYKFSRGRVPDANRDGGEGGDAETMGYLSTLDVRQWGCLSTPDVPQ
ncbi:hypothetical protein JMJ35_002682 [Cladonia borealis]|uniref:Uncharacterized protein n=1 Tax=Cladonia borealis TaxID=184061 RepID=A0AA39R8K5_9LECA|nr:hypothetical protein JMJ35_002682 [Cladonia borealis]